MNTSICRLIHVHYNNIYLFNDTYIRKLRIIFYVFHQHSHLFFSFTENVLFLKPHLSANLVITKLDNSQWTHVSWILMWTYTFRNLVMKHLKLWTFLNNHCDKYKSNTIQSFLFNHFLGESGYFNWQRTHYSVVCWHVFVRLEYRLLCENIGLKF